MRLPRVRCAGLLPLPAVAPAAVSLPGEGYDPVTVSCPLVSKGQVIPVFVCMTGSSLPGYMRGTRKVHQRYTRGVPRRRAHARDLLSRRLPELPCSHRCQEPAPKPDLYYVRSFRGRRRAVRCPSARHDLTRGTREVNVRYIRGARAVHVRSVRGARRTVHWVSGRALSRPVQLAVQRPVQPLAAELRRTRAVGARTNRTTLGDCSCLSVS
jgi:hypothetical protein